MTTPTTLHGNDELGEVTRRITTSPITTLVVDDDAASREMLAKILRRAGHRALLASNAEDGLRLFREERPDMVFMDVLLPGMDGNSATQIMKRESSGRWLPVIVVSIRDQLEHVLDGLQAGADDYLTKPIEVDHVLAKLRNVTRSLLFQRQLSNSLRLSQVIMDHIGDALLCCDDQGVVQLHNRAAAKLFSYPEGLNDLEITQLLPDLSSSLRPSAGVSASLFGAGRRRDGHVFSVEAHMTGVLLGTREMTVYSVRDVTQRLREERQMLNDAAHLREYKAERERENSLAQEMLDKLLHRGQQQATNVQFSIEAANGFSGDAVAAVRSPSGRLFVMLADATGHGLAAAISLVPALSVLHAMVARDCALAEIVAELNRKLLELLPVGRFMAAALVCLEEAKRSGEVWIGGMPPVFLLSEDGQVQQRFESEHLALGIAAGDIAGLPTTPFTWVEGQQLVLASDGVLEAENTLGEAFGEHGLLQSLRRANCSGRLACVATALKRHLAGLKCGDDASIAIVDLA